MSDVVCQLCMTAAEYHAAILQTNVQDEYNRIHGQEHGNDARRDALVTLAMCAWLRKHISKIEDRAKVDADVTMPEEKSAAVVGGKVVAYTSRITRRPELKVLDPDAFTAWVAEHYPSEVMQSVRPAFLSILQDQARQTGAVLGPGGEVCDCAVLDDAVIYTTTRLTKDADLLEPLLSKVTLADLPEYIQEL